MSEYIEIKVNPMIFLFESCCFEGNTAYLYYHNHNGGIQIDCKAGSYNDIEYAAKRAIRCSEACRGSIHYGFVNTIIVFYQLASGNNWFTSAENVLNSFPYQANNEFKKYNLRMEMTTHSLTFTHNGFSVSLEDAARILLNDAPTNITSSSKTLSLSEEWVCTSGYIEQERSGNYGYVIPDDTTNFSAVAYICPKCEHHISKILLPSDTTVKITGRKSMKINKAFACKYCNMFFAPFPNEKLGSGYYAYLNVDKRRFTEITQIMDVNYRLPNL